MKIIMSIVLIILMGMSNQKENAMIREDGKTERQVRDSQRRVAERTEQVRPPAWMGRTQRTRERDEPAQTGGGFGQAGAGGFSNNGNGFGSQSSPPAWASGSNINAPSQPAFTGAPINAPAQPAFRPQSPTVGTAPTPQPVSRIPNWMYNNPNMTAGWMAGAENINPNNPRVLSGSFLSATGNIAQGNNGNVRTVLPETNEPIVPNWMYNNPNMTAGWVAGAENINPNMPTTPTGSFLAGDGLAVLNENQQAEYPWPGVNTFIGAGGQAVRGPASNVPIIRVPTRGVISEPSDRVVTNNSSGSGGGSGFGSSYGGNWRRGGGGGGGGGGYGYDAPAWMSNDPQYMNLYSWNYKG